MNCGEFPMSTILVVDDERLIRWSLRDRLARAGYSVREAGDGAEAEERLGDRNVDLVLLDLQIPDVAGMTLLHRIPHDPHPPAVIMMTAHATVETARQAAAL